MRRDALMIVGLAVLGVAAAGSGESAHAQELIGGVPQDTLAPVRRTVLSPWGAFWRSLVIPGWGQSELDAKTRGAVYFVAEGASVWMWIRTQRRLDHARRLFPEEHPLVSSRKQQREDWIALTLFWAFFNAADAWVTAHLHGFETKPIPVPGEAVGLFVGWSLPLDLSDKHTSNP
ncbi:MAG: hypothetical protein HY702_06835 [Gemmatimonadetes bacterium]|nr:hypothetical protein [Gemmatimonadota bacterium]